MKIGVIGTGAMGENHVRVYSSLVKYCQLVGVFDINQIRTKEIAQKYNITSFPSLEELLQNVDAVSIAVPTEYHFSVALACIRHNVHMLIEKPITSTITEAEELIKKANEESLKLQVGHIELFNPTIQVLKDILKEEEIIAIDIHRMSPYDERIKNVDVVNDLMIHDLYILYELLNDEIEKFYALGCKIEETTKHAMIITKFKKGVLAQLTASYKTEEKIRTIRIVTKRAFIQANLIDKKVLISRSTNFFLNSMNENYRQQNIVEKIAIPEKEPLKMQLMNFIDCINKNLIPTVTGDDGIKVLTISNKISDFIKDNYKN